MKKRIIQTRPKQPDCIRLIHVKDNLYKDYVGGKEPYFTRHVENGKVLYMHETGYGCLPEDRVQIVEASETMKNPQLKRAYSTDEYTPDMVQELIKCKKDPVYFLKNYIKVQHPVKGTVPFALFEYQERFVRHMQDNRFTITLQPRQCGKTLTVAMYLLWYAMFNEDATLLIASKNQGHALEIAARVRFAYEELPNWIKCGLKYYNRHNIEFDNGSRIISEATTEKTGRGLAITKIYLDELAFINPRIQNALWASLTPTLSTGGSAIISSTPNGDTELFATLWRGANSVGDGKPGVNGYAPFRVYWQEHPERDEKYWDMMVNQLGLLTCRQEVGCEFLSSDALLINSLKLIQLQHSLVVAEDMGFKFWENPEELGGQGKTYMVGVDPATGNGSDFSVIEVYEFPSLNQVAEWRSNEINIPLLYAKLKWILEKLCRMRGRGRADVIWTFERNGIGEALSALYQNDEKQPEHAELYNDSPTSGKLGVFTSGRTKVLACLQLKNLIEKVNNCLNVKSAVTLEELKNFVARGGTYQAKSGAHDDTVMATILIVRLLKRLSEYDERAFKQVNEYVSADFDPNDQFGDEPVPAIF